MPFNTFEKSIIPRILFLFLLKGFKMTRSSNNSEFSENFIFKECVVIGAGISGIACARWMKVHEIRIKTN